MDLIQMAQQSAQSILNLENRLTVLRQRAQDLLAKKQEFQSQAEADCQQVGDAWQATQSRADHDGQAIESALESLSTRLDRLYELARQGAEDCSLQVEEALSPLRALQAQLDSSANQLEALQATTRDALREANRCALELFERARRPLEETSIWLRQEFSPRLQEQLLQLDEQAHRLSLMSSEAGSQIQMESQRGAEQLGQAGDDFRHTAAQAHGTLQETAETALRDIQTQQKTLFENHSEADELLTKEVQQIAGNVGEALQQLQEMDSRFQNDARSSNQGLDAMLRMAEDYQKALE